MRFNCVGAVTSRMRDGQISQPQHDINDNGDIG